MGSDVLQGSSQLQKNHGRIHARYAKEGHATRLTFQDVRINGIPNSGSIWFYSIQGLFKVVFEYLTESAQRDCLLKLQNVWLNRYEDHLPEKVSARFVDSREISQVDVIEVEVQESAELSPSQEINEETTLIINPNNEETKRSNTNQVENSHVTQNVVHDALGDQIKFIHCHDVQNVTQCHNVPNASHCHDSQNVPTSQTERVPKLLQLDDGIKIIQLVSNLLKEQLSKYKTTGATYDILADLNDVIKLYNTEFSMDSQDKLNSFPFQIIHKYFQAICDESCHEKFVNDFGIPLRRSIAMEVVSEWLGDQFSLLHDDISRHVEQFKLGHIDHIDNLPASHILIDQLFPKPMKTLLMNWMRKRSSDQDIAEFSNKSYDQPPRKKDKIAAKLSSKKSQAYESMSSSSHTEKAVSAPESGDKKEINRKRQSDVLDDKGSSLIPFVQLMLELVNNSLISGVAHVIFTRLLHNT